MRFKTLFLLLLPLSFLLTACSSNTTSSPEDEIRQFIERGIEAAENRSSGNLGDMVVADYQDKRGYNKEQLIKLMRVYFFRHKNIHLFHKIQEINLFGRSEAEVKLHVAMAGSVISDASVLSSLRAQIYRFELQLVKEEEWLLQTAKWAPASASDLQ